MSDVFDNFDGSMTFTGSYDMTTLSSSRSKSLLIILSDKNEWLEEKVNGLDEIVVRYKDKDHVFTPSEVLRALYAVKEG